MLRRLVLVGLMVVAFEGSTMQLVIGTLLAAIFLLFQVFASPYKDQADDFVAMAASFALVALFLCSCAARRAHPLGARCAWCMCLPSRHAHVHVLCACMPCAGTRSRRRPSRRCRSSATACRRSCAKYTCPTPRCSRKSRSPRCSAPWCSRSSSSGSRRVPPRTFSHLLSPSSTFSGLLSPALTFSRVRHLATALDGGLARALRCVLCARSPDPPAAQTPCSHPARWFC